MASIHVILSKCILQVSMAISKFFSKVCWHLEKSSTKFLLACRYISSVNCMSVNTSSEYNNEPRKTRRMKLNASITLYFPSDQGYLSEMLIRQSLRLPEEGTIFLISFFIRICESSKDFGFLFLSYSIIRSITFSHFWTSFFSMNCSICKLVSPLAF